MLVFIVINAKYPKNISGSWKTSRDISVIYETKKFPQCLRNNSDDFDKCGSKHLLQHLEHGYLAAFCSINKLWESLDGAFSHKTSYSVICFQKINFIWKSEASDKQPKGDQINRSRCCRWQSCYSTLKETLQEKNQMRKMGWNMFIGWNQLGYSCQGVLKWGNK